MSPAEKQRRRQHRKDRKFRQDLKRGQKRWQALGNELPGDQPLVVRASRTSHGSSATRELQLLSYDITYDARSPLVDSLASLLSPAEHDRLFCLVNDDPAAAAAEVTALLERVPDQPVLLNWLGRCYSLLGEDEQSDAAARRNFEKNPDYLFARVNYAQFALRSGQFDQIPVIFDNQFDLKLLYPGRNEFHVSEFLAFSSVMCEYYLRTGDIERAEMMLEAMERIEPDHEVTCRLREIVETGLFLGLVRRLVGMRRGRRRRHLR